MIFRYLKADEIDCRVATVNDNGCSLLLYKDARVDMVILDETVGSLNWKREHTRDNANCIVSIWDNEKKQWISKEDTGTESFSEKEKGLASDSFKRACFNWGIGRELYTAPFIWIADKSYIKTKADGKKTVSEKFKVKKISIDNGIITELLIVDSKNKIVFTYSNSINKKDDTKKNLTDDEKKEIVINAINEKIEDEGDRSLIYELIAEYGKLTLSDCNLNELKLVNNKLKKRIEEKEIQNTFKN